MGLAISMHCNHWTICLINVCKPAFLSNHQTQHLLNIRTTPVVDYNASVAK